MAVPNIVELNDDSDFRLDFLIAVVVVVVVIVVTVAALMGIVVIVVLVVEKGGSRKFKFIVSVWDDVFLT